MEAAEAPAANGLPSFITAPPPARASVGEVEAPEAFGAAERAPAREQEGVNFHLNPRRRRGRPPRAAADEAGETRQEEAAPSGELPFEPDRV